MYDHETWWLCVNLIEELMFKFLKFFKIVWYLILSYQRLPCGENRNLKFGNLGLRGAADRIPCWLGFFETLVPFHRGFWFWEIPVKEGLRWLNSDRFRKQWKFPILKGKQSLSSIHFGFGFLIWFGFYFLFGLGI